MFVLDCSATVPFLFEDEASADTEALLDRLREDGATVPSLWHLGLGNVLAGAERAGRISESQLTAYLEIIRQLPVVTDTKTGERALREVLALARKEGLTTYDAAYLELSLRLNLPLATRDNLLATVARNLGVDIITT